MHNDYNNLENTFDEALEVMLGFETFIRFKSNVGNYPEFRKRALKSRAYPSALIKTSFVWAKSPEKYQYWDNVYHRLTTKELAFMPPVPMLTN